MHPLQYCRQFLLSPIDCPNLNPWKHTKLGNYNLYVHPSATLSKISNAAEQIELALVGDILNPRQVHQSNEDILKDIAEHRAPDSIGEKLYSYSGRFVLVIKINQAYYLFHDACGLKMVFYTQFNNQFFAASQPLLLKEVIPLKEGEQYHQFHNSHHKKTDIEFWIPSGCSLYETVKHLVPNHYLSLSGLEQKRYWPNKVPKKMQIEEAIKQSSYLLKNIMEAANHRFKLAMPMTAGWDSRIILSASKNIAKDLFFYTLQYRNLNPASNDIAFPKKLLQRLGYQHTIINCNKAINEHFLKIYRNNSDMAHEDWAKIANGMLDEFPADRVCIKGSCAEIARGGAYLNWKEMQFGTLEQILEYEQDWGIFDFTKNAVSQWLQATLPVLHGYKIETLFDWEHCMGSWQAQNQLEWDIVQETFTPFNNRELLDVLLSIDFRYRKWPNFRLFKKIIETLWKEVLSVPINSKNVVLKKVRNVFFSKILKRKG